MEITGKARYGEHIGDNKGYYVQCGKFSQIYLCNDNVWREWSIQDIGIDNLFYMSEERAKELCKEHNIKYGYEKEIQMDTILGKCVMVDTPEVSNMIQDLAFKVGIIWGSNYNKRKRYYDMWCWKGAPEKRYIKFLEDCNCMSADNIPSISTLVSLDEAVRLLKEHKELPKPPHIEVECDGIIHQVRFNKDGIKIGCTNISKRIVRQIAKAVEEFC